MIVKPMLAATVLDDQLEGLQWPLIGSPKLDGIRCINHPKLGVVTRSFKPVPNVHIREELRRILGELPLDGELFAVDDAGEPLDFNPTQSAVMSRSGRPKFVYAVFDHFGNPEAPFEDRFADTWAVVDRLDAAELQIVPHDIIKDPEEFLILAEQNVEAGYEGTMLRDPKGIYKQGRSTLKQQWLVKYKTWVDAEGRVVGFQERMHNANEDIKDNFGYAKRTSHKDGMEPMNTLGALELHTAWGLVSVGSGLDDATRKEIWDNRPRYLGRMVTFKFQPFGMKDVPRFPIFKGFRADE